MSERCPICDEEECHHTPDEKELVKRRAEVIVLEKAIDGWRSVNRSLSSKLSAAEKERDELKAKLAVAVEALSSIESGSVYLDNGKGKTPKTRAREALKAINGGEL